MLLENKYLNERMRKLRTMRQFGIKMRDKEDNWLYKKKYGAGIEILVNLISFSLHVENEPA